jgi:hypothetical protein
VSRWPASQPAATQNFQTIKNFLLLSLRAVLRINFIERLSRFKATRVETSKLLRNVRQDNFAG